MVIKQYWSLLAVRNGELRDEVNKSRRANLGLTVITGVIFLASGAHFLGFLCWLIAVLKFSPEDWAKQARQTLKEAWQKAKRHPRAA
jgi:hypothetical protein